MTAKDYIGEKYDWQLTDFKGPHRSKASAGDALYIPSSDKVDILEKLEEGQVPRFPEDEGIYIGERPKVCQRNQNRLERRYLFQCPSTLSLPASFIWDLVQAHAIYALKISEKQSF